MAVSLCIVLVAFVSIAESTRTCSIHGLPRLPTHGDVTVLHWTRNTELQLSCRCTVYTPQWLAVKTEENTTTTIVRPVGCQDNGMPCEGAQTFIDPDKGVSPDKFTFLQLNVSLNQTTLLQCYTKFQGQDRDSVLVLIKDDPTPQPSQTTATSTAVYPTPVVSSSSVSVITHTVTQTVCPTPSTSPISDRIKDRPITSTSHQLTPTQTPEVQPPGVADRVIENIGGTPGLAMIAAMLVLVITVIALVVTIIVMKIKYNKKLENRDHVGQTSDSVALDMPAENLAATDNKYTLEEYKESPILSTRRPTHILANTPSSSSSSDWPLPNTR